MRDGVGTRSSSRLSRNPLEGLLEPGVAACALSDWVVGWRVVGRAGGLGAFLAVGGGVRRPQVAVRAVWWRWSFIRLWVVVMSRHSERAADRPRRWKRSARRLCLMCAKTGSIIHWRWR